jgi:hypothetical protein
MLGTDTSWTPSTPTKARKKEVGRPKSFQVRDVIQRGDTPAKRKRVDARQEFKDKGDVLGRHIWRGGEEEHVSYETRVTTHGAKPSMRYARETPWPTYSQWGHPRWIDLDSGTQFRVADGSDKANLISRGVITRPEWTPDSPKKSGAQLLYLRFPKGGRGVAGERFPIRGDKLRLLDLETGYLWDAKVQFAEGYRKRKAATGNVCVESLERKAPATTNQVERAYTKLPKRYRKKRLLRASSLRQI